MGKKTTPEAPDAAEQAAATVKARVLVDSSWGRCNDVVDVTPEQAAAGAAAGELDTDETAVAYALAQQG